VGVFKSGGFFKGRKNAEKINLAELLIQGLFWQAILQF
jgi:hypothetical protein